MGLLMFLVVAGTSIWVVVDASNLNVRKGMLGGGLTDMGPGGWLACCLLLWIFGFPAYLTTRPKYLAAKAASRLPAWGGPISPMAG
jgi:hypothetical protein